jgi:poly(A) polymerase
VRRILRHQDRQEAGNGIGELRKGLAEDSSDTGSPTRERAAGVVRRLRDAGHEAYLVGGCVRDLLRGAEPEDYDIATSARPEEVMALFPRTVPVGVSFGVVLVLEGGADYEVATFRTERGYADGRRPLTVSFATAREDVLRRDFTINGLLMDPGTGEVIDYVGGRRDIEARVVRAIGDAETRFAEDHLRMLRAVRFAANLDFAPEQGLLDAIRRLAGKIRNISAERIREELTKLLTRGAGRRGMELLADSGLLAEILPEIQALRGVTQPPAFHPEGDVWEHTLMMLALLPRGETTDSRLAWAVVMHDAGKALTRFENGKGIHFYGHVQKGEEIARSVLCRLRFSAAEAETIVALVHFHMLFSEVKRMRPNRLKRFLRTPDFDLHLELHRLDCLASHGLLDSYEFCKEKLSEIPREELNPPRLLTGRDLIAMGFRPGPLFSDILGAVEDAQLNGEIKTAEDARILVTGRWGKGPDS